MDGEASVVKPTCRTNWYGGRDEKDSQHRKSCAHYCRIDLRIVVCYSRLITFKRFKLQSKPHGLRKIAFDE